MKKQSKSQDIEERLKGPLVPFQQSLNEPNIFLRGVVGPNTVQIEVFKLTLRSIRFPHQFRFIDRPCHSFTRFFSPLRNVWPVFDPAG